jgi:putative heme degradation protein
MTFDVFYTDKVDKTIHMKFFLYRENAISAFMHLTNEELTKSVQLIDNTGKVLNKVLMEWDCENGYKYYD